jgi:hypothetical protein
MAQGLGGLIAAGVLSGMEGTRGIRGWRWVCSLSLPGQAPAHRLQLFIIEGSITVAFGLLVPFILADYPARWVMCPFQCFGAELI